MRHENGRKQTDATQRRRDTERTRRGDAKTRRHGEKEERRVTVFSSLSASPPLRVSASSPLRLCVSVSQHRSPARPWRRALRPRRTGMGLIAVLAVLALMGGAMIASMAQSGAIAFQTQHMQRQADVGNLQASGAAWARANRAARAAAAPGRAPAAKVLDVTALDVPGGLLSVEAIGADANAAAVRIACQCGSGNRTTQGTVDVVIRGRRASGD